MAGLLRSGPFSPDPCDLVPVYLAKYWLARSGFKKGSCSMSAGVSRFLEIFRSLKDYTPINPNIVMKNSPAFLDSEFYSIEKFVEKIRWLIIVITSLEGPAHREMSFVKLWHVTEVTLWQESGPRSFGDLDCLDRSLGSQRLGPQEATGSWAVPMEEKWSYTQNS